MTKSSLEDKGDGTFSTSPTRTIVRVADDEGRDGFVDLTRVQSRVPVHEDGEGAW